MPRFQKSDATPPWHALLAPIPADAILRRKPVGTVGVEGDTEETSRLDATPSKPDQTEVSGIRAIVAELMRRAFGTQGT